MERRETTGGRKRSVPVADGTAGRKAKAAKKVAASAASDEGATRDSGKSVPTVTVSKRVGHPLVGKRIAQTGRLLFEGSGLERVALIRAGVPAAQVVELSEAMAISRDGLFTMLQLPRSTVDRKIRDQARLSPEQSERVIGLERLIGQVQAMVLQSGEPAGFDAGRWVGDWLDRSLPALGGAKPGELMDTIEGQRLVSRLLEQALSGAYA